MHSELIVRSWRPWRLSVDRIGPFRESIERITFSDGKGGVSNLFMLAAGNGRGKTTILQSLTFAMRMLAPDFPSAEDLRHGIVAERDSRLQLDVIVELESDQVTRSILLSLSWGDVGTSGIGGWTSSPLEDELADRWLRYGWTHARLGRDASPIRAELTLSEDRAIHGWDDVRDSSAWMQALLDAIAAGHDLAWPGFNQTVSGLPTVLYFSASRDIVQYEQQAVALGRPTTPRFQPAHYFDREGHGGFASLDNLMVWYYWLSPKDFASARDFVNSMVFPRDDAKYIKDEPDRDPPQIVVMNHGSAHALDRLSSGEKNLVQFALRVGAHRTLNSIIIIDEIELHLHPEYQRRMIQFLKEFVVDSPESHVIFTTHSLEVMSEFRFELDEIGLRKGGEMLLS